VIAAEESGNTDITEDEAHIDDDENEEKPEENKESAKDTLPPEENQNKLIVLYNSDSKSKERLAISLIHQLETAGYACTAVGEPYAIYLEKVANCHYDFYVGEVNPDNSANMTFMFGAERSAQNICTYRDEELSTLVSNINRMSGKESKTVAWENFEKYYKEKVFQIPLYFTKKEVYVNKKVGGSLTPNISSPLSGFDQLYIAD